MSERAPLDAARLRALTGTRWARVDVLAETTSTNAALIADVDAADRTALAAEYQSAGRGRFDRTWTSRPRAGLTFSVLLRPSRAPLAMWGWIPLLTGVALAEAVASSSGVEATLKWPNDLLLSGDAPRKAAGILAQAGEGRVVVGIGLNVSSTANELPSPDATSLALAGVRDVDRTALLADILTRIDARAAQWDDVAGDAAACGLLTAYRERCATLGSEVRVTTADGGAVLGTARDVDELGRLVIETADGAQSIGAGDVEHLRPLRSV